MNRLTAALLLLLAADGAHAAITGTLIDETGKPIAGATIRVYPTEPSREARKRLVSAKPEREPLTSTTSKDDGSFSADTKETPAVDLVIEAGARRRIVSLSDNLDLGPVLLREPSPRKITVTAGGKPVPNVLVVFGPSSFTRTDAAGTFTANEASAATFIHPDYAIEAQAPLSGGEVKLQKGVALRGRVVGTDGKPAARATIVVQGYPVAESADDGTFTIAHAPANWTVVLAFAGANAGAGTRGGNAPLKIRLRRGGVVSGVVRDSITGDPVPGATVGLRMNEGREPISVPADAKGRFTFDPMPPGNYNLWGQHWSYTIEGAVFTLADSATRTLSARPYAKVSGRVIDEARNPVAGALISAAGNFDSTKRTISDAAGNFLFRMPPDLRLMRVVAMKRGYAAGASQRWTLKPGEAVKDALITLPQGFPLQVRVLDRGRRPVAGVRVGLATREEQWATPAACDDPARESCSVTDGSGSVTYRIVDGDYWLSARGEQVKIVPLNREATLTARSSPFLLEVEAGAMVSGRVLFADGTPVAGAEVNVQTSMVRRDETADAAGAFTIDSLPASRITLVASTPDRRLVSAGVDVTPPASNVTITLPKGGRIEGRVVERGTGRPVADFTVSPGRRGANFSFGPPPPPQSFHSDDGVFAVDNVPPGNATLSVSATGYVTASRTDIVVEEGGSVTGVEVQLDRGARVAGRVTAGGKPLAGASVTIAFSPGTFAGPQPRAVTDGDGEYALDGVAPGERTIEVRRNGFVTRKKSVELSAAREARLDVELDRGFELRGRVVDSGGAPVAGANVGARASSFGGEEIRAVSDSDGSFVLEGLSDARYNVSARKTGYVSANERDVDLPATAPLTLTLKPGATVTGRVTGLQPHELAGVFVNAASPASGGGSASAQTDSSGAFTLRGVPDGPVMISASLAGGSRRAQKSITVTNGVAPPVEIDFAEGFTMRGKVTMNGMPVTIGSINFNPTGPGPNRPPGVYARINNGTYEASGLGAGEYRVMLSAPELQFEEKLQVGGSGTHDFDVHGANVRGRVVDAKSGAPVPNAQVSIRSKAPGSWRNAQADSDGRFVLTAVADDSYTLSVNAPTYSPATKEVSVAGGMAPDVEVRLETGTEVVVKVVDAATGKLLSNANASVADAKGSFITGNMQRDEEGIKLYLQPGEYAMNVFAQGYSPQTKLPLTVPTSVVRVAMQRGGALAFQTSQPLHVRLVPAGGGKPVFQGTATPNQLMGPQNLPPGSYLLEVLGRENAVEKAIPVTVIAGETVTVPLD